MAMLVDRSVIVKHGKSVWVDQIWVDQKKKQKQPSLKWIKAMMRELSQSRCEQAIIMYI